MYIDGFPKKVLIRINHEILISIPPLAIKAKEWLQELDTETINSLYTIFKADFMLANYSNFSHPDFPLPLDFT